MSHETEHERLERLRMSNAKCLIDAARLLQLNRQLAEQVSREQLDCPQAVAESSVSALIHLLLGVSQAAMDAPGAYDPLRDKNRKFDA
jgi:hypothetical protein